MVCTFLRFFAQISMKFGRNSTTEKSPIRRLLSRGNTSPFHNFWHFSRCVPLGTPHPRVALADASVFSCAWCRLPCAAPVTHQDQGLVTSRSGARRRPLASSMPQKTLGSLSCPIVYSVQITWLPRGSTFARAHGRGVAPLGHAVAGHLYGLRPGRIRTGGYYPTFPPASSLNPTASQTSAKGFRRLKGHEVAHHVIAGP
jgi:hypothetical protein